MAEFRTKKDRSLELKSVFHECEPGRRKIAVKVVDIFGNDTMTIVDVSVGKNGEEVTADHFGDVSEMVALVGGVMILNPSNSMGLECDRFGEVAMNSTGI